MTHIEGSKKLWLLDIFRPEILHI